jgi:predicted signal transduction protein with EAL and GGDEF domain
VARLAGDEFVVLIEEHGGPEEVMIVAQKVLSMLERPVLIDWREVAVPASIGIASFPEDGDDLETLVRNADAAMYQAKERGRNNFQFYSEDLNRLSRDRMIQESRVRSALERDEFFICYQPEIELATGRTVALEALIRWRDPEAGVVLPAEFLPLAEENGSVIAIGRWVFDRALADLKLWKARGIDAPLAVNLSARQLQHPDLVNEIFRALQANGVEPSSLRLEIPESALIDASDTTHRTLRALRGMGIRLAIDDFGTGYSSLGLVRGLPVDVVKIDRSLVSACVSQKECAAIVEATAAMSRALGIHLVAEGVETEEQRTTMAALGCDAAHGQLLGAPLEAPRAGEALAATRGATAVGAR